MSTLSPNMNLIISTVGVDSGLLWEQNLNASQTIIDGHNHSSGQGVAIQPNGLNINSDLSFGSQNAVDMRAVRFTSQVSPIVNSGAEVGEIYVSGNELYYNDVSGGNQVQITNNGSVNAGSGSISGLPSGTASASFSAGTFVWQSATSTAANMDAGSYIFRNSSVSSFGMTLQPPAAMGSNTVVTLPAIPGSTKLLQMSSGGAITANADADGTSLQFTSNTLSIKNNGVTIGKIDQTSVIPTLQSQVFTSSGSFVVPAGKTVLMATIFGGGGGGAGGGGYNASTSGGGGGGGAGSLPITMPILVTPGETLTITVGSGGSGGIGGGNAIDGTNGANGDPSYILRGATILATGGGGTRGTGNGTGSGGSGAGGQGGFNGFTFETTGGSGGADSTAGGSGSAGYSGAVGGSGGTSSSANGGGGGGGGAGTGAGGAGGNGSGGAGSNGVNYGSGGGGGAGGQASAFAGGGNGGAGRFGNVTLVWGAFT